MPVSSFCEYIFNINIGREINKLNIGREINRQNIGKEINRINIGREIKKINIGRKINKIKIGRKKASSQWLIPIRKIQSCKLSLQRGENFNNL